MQHTYSFSVLEWHGDFQQAKKFAREKGADWFGLCDEHAELLKVRIDAAAKNSIYSGVHYLACTVIYDDTDILLVGEETDDQCSMYDDEYDDEDVTVNT